MTHDRHSRRDHQGEPQPRTLTLELPAEFIALCALDDIAPEFVIRGFIADLCELYGRTDDGSGDDYLTNGSDERDLALAYYERVGYPWWSGRYSDDCGNA